MPDMRDVLTIILGGGRGTRLFPLTHMRSKPAVPIGGQYRLIDVPISNCLHAGLTRIFVLTQFNSASLNRHVAQTYRLDSFSGGFVEVLAAEQTPDNADWFQGTADAVRQAARHFAGLDAEYYLILAGDHLYRMDFCEMVETHIETGADITIAAQAVGPADATGMGIFRFDREGHIVGFEEKPDRDRLAALGQSVPSGSAFAPRTSGKPFVASMGIVRLLPRRAARHSDEARSRLRQGSHSCGALHPPGSRLPVSAATGRTSARSLPSTRRTSCSHSPDAPFRFFHPHAPIYTHQRFLPGSRFIDSRVDSAIVCDGCSLESCTIGTSVVGIRTVVRRGASITRSVLLGADIYEDPGDARLVETPLGIGRDVVLDRVVVDKNARIGDGARLTNAQGIDRADGDGYYIRDGIVIVPKAATIPAGAIV